MEIRNEKFLPLVWLELFFPLSRTLCLTPGDSRCPEDWEMTALEEEGASSLLVGETRLSFLLWYESLRFSCRWTARRRGVYSTEGWRLRTGDGFGLVQMEQPIPREAVRKFAVYPRLVPVAPDLFLRNLWNADTGTRGVMEDPTVIRSTREYRTYDSLKRVNWRLCARGLPLSVNVYEDILPRSVHFLLDGESFCGPEPHREELEEALSILASELVRLEEVRCGLSLCRGEGGPAVNLFPGAGTEPMLQALAAYQPELDKWDENHEKILLRPPVFNAAPLLEHAQGVGRFYYIAYDTPCLQDRTLLHRLGQENTTLLTFREAPPYGEFETICLVHLKEGTAHA